jgi:hypothetical protein
MISSRSQSSTWIFHPYLWNNFLSFMFSVRIIYTRQLPLKHESPSLSFFCFFRGCRALACVHIHSSNCSEWNLNASFFTIKEWIGLDFYDVVLGVASKKKARSPGQINEEVFMQYFTTSKMGLNLSCQLDRDIAMRVYACSSNFRMAFVRRCSRLCSLGYSGLERSRGLESDDSERGNDGSWEIS